MGRINEERNSLEEIIPMKEIEGGHQVPKEWDELSSKQKRRFWRYFISGLLMLEPLWRLFIDGHLENSLTAFLLGDFWKMLWEIVLVLWEIVLVVVGYLLW